MLTKAESVLFYTCVVLLVVGGLNWGVEGIAKKDILYYLITLANKTGGSELAGQLPDPKKPQNEAAKIVPRIVYIIVGVAALIAVILMIKNAATGQAPSSYTFSKRG